MIYIYYTYKSNIKYKFKAITHRVCGSGMGKEMQRKGSNVLLCFWQCGQVREDLLGQKNKKK